MRNSQWIAVIVYLAGATGVRAEAPSASQNAALKAVISAWERRQDEIRTVEFAWTTERTDRKGSISATLHPSLTKGSTSPVPSTDSTYTWRDAVWFDGRRVRWEFDGPRRYTALDPPDGRLIPTKEVSVFDGERSKQYQIADDTDVVKQGHILTNAPLPIQNNFVSMPVFAFVRPFNPEFGGVDKPSLRFVREEASTTAERRFVVERQRPELVWRYWVDPTRAHGITRYVVESPPGKLRQQLDVTYRRDSAHGWLPDKWTLASFAPSGAPTFAHSCAATTLRINEPMPDSTFDIEFPEGILLVDENGKAFTVTKGGADPELKPRPWPGQTELSGSSGPPWTLIIAGAIALSVVLVLVWFRQRRSLHV